MTTKTELLERAKTENIAIHTPTEEQAKILLSELDKSGYVWADGDKLTDKTRYETFEEDTCYGFNGMSGMPKEILYSSLWWNQALNITIVEFTDINFKENT